MNRKKLINMVSVIMAGAILMSSCVSTTIVQSNPSGAKLYLNGENVGTTPYTHSDTRIVGSTNTVVLEKEGYEPFMTSFSRDEEADVGAIIGGIFLLFPFLWTMKYKPTHTYELIPEGKRDPSSTELKNKDAKLSKAERLRELKKLLDEEIITQEEFEREKKKILEEEGKE